MFGSLSKLRYPLLGAAAAALALTTATALAGPASATSSTWPGKHRQRGELAQRKHERRPAAAVENSATTQNAFGVLGRITAGAPGTQSAGLRGINSATNGNGFGIWGFHQSNGIGVLG